MNSLNLFFHMKTKHNCLNINIIVGYSKNLMHPKLAIRRKQSTQKWLFKHFEAQKSDYLNKSVHPKVAINKNQPITGQLLAG